MNAKSIREPYIQGKLMNQTENAKPAARNAGDIDAGIVSVNTSIQAYQDCIIYPSII